MADPHAIPLKQASYRLRTAFWSKDADSRLHNSPAAGCVGAVVIPGLACFGELATREPLKEAATARRRPWPRHECFSRCHSGSAHQRDLLRGASRRARQRIAAPWREPHTAGRTFGRDDQNPRTHGVRPADATAQRLHPSRLARVVAAQNSIGEWRNDAASPGGRKW